MDIYGRNEIDIKWSVKTLKKRDLHMLHVAEEFKKEFEKKQLV